MFREIKKVCLLLLLIACAAVSSSAQSLDVKISVSSVAPPRVRVEGARTNGARAWSFLNAYAGVIGLGERVDNLSLADAGGQAVGVRKLAPGEYEAEREAARFSYDVKLDPPPRPGDAAHVSWLTGERGLLMLADLLPSPLGEAKVRLDLPAGWAVSSAESLNASRQYEIADAGKAVFLIGRDVSSRTARRGAMEYASVMTGAWAFDGDEAARTVDDILKDYEKVLGGTPRRRATIIICPFPLPAPAQSWSAETRGGSVVLLSGQWPSKTMALSRLDGILSHELLHLWVPNGLALEGEYDWFYEGFTLYLSMRAGMRRGQLTFQDWLNAVGRAYDGYRVGRGAQEFSLLEASRRRWSLAPSLVYDKGMLVAFLYDLTLLQRTGGKSSLEDVYRALFRRHGPASARAEGNRAVIDALNGVAGMQGFTKRFVEGPTAIDLAAETSAFGLRLEGGGARTRVVVADGLSREQSDLLRNLGYNEKPNSAARSLREKMKKRMR